MAHAYADTFSHYGFSGVSSRLNKVDGESFELDVEKEEVKAYIMNKFSRFLVKYSPTFLIKNYRNIASQGASVTTGALGHGAGGTYPDRPFLKWQFTYERGTRRSGWRNNHESFLEGCEQLHKAFRSFAEKTGLATNQVPFNEIKKEVSDILSLEANKEKRIKAWRQAIKSGKLFTTSPAEEEALHYSAGFWEQQKCNFEKMSHST